MKLKQYLWMLFVFGSASFLPPLSAADALPPGHFAFPMIWDDSLPGTATDLSFLNVKPAGKNGRIIVRNGQFVEQATGNRVRFIGFNMGVPVAFCSHEEAVKIAKHLAKAGVNVVRIHGIDNDGTNDFWRKEKGTLIDVKRPDTQHFQPEQLDRLDFLIAELLKNGIYINFNLKVSRRATAADGVFPYSGEAKRFDRFHARWIELQKQYAKALLTRKNPYTGQSLAEDPGVLCIELNNENSIADTWRKLPEKYAEEYRTLWNQWLKQKYSTDSALQKAWMPWSSSPGDPLTSSRMRWKSRDGKGGSATNLSLTETASGKNGTPPYVKAVLSVPAVLESDRQIFLDGIRLKPRTAHTLRFRVRSGRSFQFGIQMISSDRSVSVPIARKFNSDASWREYSVILKPETFPEGTVFQAVYPVGTLRCPLEIADFEILPGARWDGRFSLSRGNIGFELPGTDCQFADEKDFIADLDRRFNEEMRYCLRKELKVKALIVDTQISFGGLTGLYREVPSDFTDAHAYWQHPDYTPPGWTIRNTPQLAGLVGNGRTDLGGLALLRIAGKPFSVSEYDHPNPSEFSVEMMPELALVASLQDWDALYVFSIGNFGSFGNSEKLTHKYDASNHPGKFGFFPTAALLFRTEMIRPLADGRILHLSERPWNAGGGWYDTIWQNAMPMRTLPDVLRTRISIAPEFLPFRKRSFLQKDLRPLQKDFRLFVTGKGERPVLGASTDKVVLLTGYLGSGSWRSGALQVETGTFSRGFASLTLIALDQKKIPESRRLLLTLASSFNNQGNVWNAERTSTDPRRGGVPGEGVVNGAFIPASLTLESECDADVFALDSRGRRKKAVTTTFARGRLSFASSPQDCTIWYEIVKKER